jgi:hypothetical protein
LECWTQFSFASEASAGFRKNGPSSDQRRLSHIGRWKIMTQDEEKILKVTKEIVVKFIEVGRVSPTQFDGFFQSVFQAVKSTVSFEERTKS